MLDLGVYRNADQVVRARRDEAMTWWREAVRELDRAPSIVYARRVARTTAGRVAPFGFTAMALAAIQGPEGVQTHILVASWGLIAFVYVVAYVAAGDRLQRALRGVARVTADPWADLERLERETPADFVRRWAVPLERASVRWPLLALSLLLPLALHLLVYGAFATPWRAMEFNVWISISVVAVGHCHLILARRA